MRLLLFVTLTTCFAQPSVDWPKVNPETLEHYSNLIKIDTTNPPGNETKAVDYLRKVLDREGIAYDVFALDPKRANIVARVKGNGSKKPIIVMGHTDTVGVQKEKWTVDPWGAVRKNGFIYGRGANDDKDNLTASLMIVTLAKRMKVQLDRDIIFIAESGEEGSSQFGIGNLVTQHWDAISAEFCLAEGGSTASRNDKVRYVSIATTEKVGRGVRLVAHGIAGHGSVPREDNPLIHLSMAVAKIGQYQMPMRLNDTTRTYFERLATISPPEEADRYNHLADPARGEAVQRYLAKNEIMHNSMLRTTIVPTIINAGFRGNVIPSEAEATLDIRAVPDEDTDKLYATIRQVINDPAVEVVARGQGGRPSPPPSRLDTVMFQALEKTTKAMFPGAVTLPSMLTGATDMAQLRARGVECYGVGPIVDENDRVGAAHTDDERLAESSLYKLVEYMWNAVMEVSSTRR